ncbi:MAG: hypothetical protein GXP63_04045 [DPANN group archaeon]|nr:hypothetical protein [DPANN group archaeon]
MIKNRIIAPKTWKESFHRFVSEDVYQDIITFVAFLENLSLEGSMVRETVPTLIREYGWIKNNSRNATPFYDDSLTMDEHEQKLQATIDQLSSAVLNPPEKMDENTQDGRFVPLWIFDGEGSLVEQATARIARHTMLISAIEQLQEETAKIRGEQHTIKAAYDHGSPAMPEESNMETTLRLKVLENNLITAALHECRTQTCKAEVISSAHDPNYCAYLDYPQLANCLIEMSTQDKSLCSRLSNDREYDLYNRCIEA